MAAASASEELVRALNKGYKSFQWPRYKPVTRQPSLSLKMTAPHQHASINQMQAPSTSSSATGEITVHCNILKNWARKHSIQFQKLRWLEKNFYLA